MLLSGCKCACGSSSLRATIRNVAFVTFLAVTYMAISTGLITFNKYLMHKDRFPYAIAIGVLHMTSSFTCNSLLLRLCPWLYPSLTDEEQRVELDRGLITRVLLPIATAFASQLILSNTALLHSSVTMLQMMKQSNVVLVYVFSLVLSLETFATSRAVALGVIFGATALTIHGEMHFSPVGFGLQGVSMFCESIKLTLQSHSLSATGRRLDAFTYVLLVAPMVLAVLLSVMLGFCIFWPDRPEALGIPPLAVIIEYRWLLLASGLLAFAMQISHAAFMKNSSAITFILTGVVMKDVVIVSVCALFLGEELSPSQVIGFCLQLLGVLGWSMMKVSPTLVPGSSASSVPPQINRGTTGLIGFDRDSECEALRAFELRSPFQGPDSENGSNYSGKSRKGMTRVSTSCSESTMAPQDDFFDEEDPYMFEKSHESTEFVEGI